MSRDRLALRYTAAYWVLAAFVAALSPHDPSGWLDFGWATAILGFAVPTTLLLWLAYGTVQWKWPAMPKRTFAQLGVAIPVGYTLVAVVAGAALTVFNQQQQLRIAEQGHAAILESFEDQTVLDPIGAIGVKLRLRVRYPLGFDMDPHLVPVPFAHLRTPEWNSGSEWSRSEWHVEPDVGTKYPPGTYEIVQVFIPSFMPRSYLPPVPGTDPRLNRCFQWHSDMSRDNILSEQASPVRIEIYLSTIPINTSTKSAYLPSTFYQTAVKDGATDCKI